MYETHTCPNCKEQVDILCDGRILKDYEWCPPCKEAHQKKDWAVRWFNHRFQVFTKRDIYMRDGFKCYICSRSLMFKDKNATFDHFIPTARGGLSDLANLRLCCTRCNNKKGDLLLEELFEQYGSPDKWV
jgi:5-methylcytosine-specific restriction endonuclease McrA